MGRRTGSCHCQLTFTFIILILHITACWRSAEKKSGAKDGDRPGNMVRPKAGGAHGKPWLNIDVQKTLCAKLNRALHKKEIAVTKLSKVKSQFMLQVKKESSKGDESADERESSLARSQADVLTLYMKQLDLNEHIIHTTIDWLDQSLAGKYKELATMKLHMESRLKSFRNATFQEEQDYNKLIEAEKEINKTRETNEHPLVGLVGQILSEISDAADDLEDGLEENMFENDLSGNLLTGGGENIEAVVRLSGDEEEAIGRLVDANGNQFVLSRSQDSTVPSEDVSLLIDLVYITATATALSYVCSLVRLPVMFGQVVAGVLLGPSVGNLLSSLVQVETLAELGVFLIMFTVGLEFSPSHIRKVILISVLSSSGLMIVMILGGLLSALLFSRSTLAEAAFIAACFSLSRGEQREDHPES